MPETTAASLADAAQSYLDATAQTLAALAARDGARLAEVSALLANRLMGTILFGVSPTDFRTMVGVPVVLMMVAMAACLIPARRAAAVDPAEILRES